VGVAPAEAAALWIGEDDGVARLAGMDPCVAGLRVAAADMPACRAEADVEPASAFLAAVRLRGGDRCGEMAARLGRAEQLREDLHAASIGPESLARCHAAYGVVVGRES
jgi:hypothetical protein